MKDKKEYYTSEKDLDLMRNDSTIETEVCYEMLMITKFGKTLSECELEFGIPVDNTLCSTDSNPGGWDGYFHSFKITHIPNVAILYLSFRRTNYRSQNRDVRWVDLALEHSFLNDQTQTSHHLFGLICHSASHWVSYVRKDIKNENFVLYDNGVEANEIWTLDEIQEEGLYVPVVIMYGRSSAFKRVVRS